MSAADLADTVRKVLINCVPSYPKNARDVQIALASLDALKQQLQQAQQDRDNGIEAFNASCRETDKFEAQAKHAKEVLKAISEIEIGHTDEIRKGQLINCKAVTREAIK